MIVQYSRHGCRVVTSATPQLADLLAPRVRISPVGLLGNGNVSLCQYSLRAKLTHTTYRARLESNVWMPGVNTRLS